MEGIVVYVIIYFLVFLLSVFITRAIFSIPKFLDYQKAQTFMLAKIARENNVSEMEIKSILDSLGLEESIKNKRKIV